MADPECAKGGGVSRILAEKRGVSFTLKKKMHENAIFSPRRGGGRTPGTPYAGSATVVATINCVVGSVIAHALYVYYIRSLYPSKHKVFTRWFFGDRSMSEPVAMQIAAAFTRWP